MCFIDFYCNARRQRLWGEKEEGVSQFYIWFPRGENSAGGRENSKKDFHLVRQKISSSVRHEVWLCEVHQSEEWFFPLTFTAVTGKFSTSWKFDMEGGSPTDSWHKMKKPTYTVVISTAGESRF